MYGIKRRKLDEAHDALSRPFRSPVKRTVPETAPSASDSIASGSIEEPKADVHQHREIAGQNGEDQSKPKSGNVVEQIPANASRISHSDSRCRSSLSDSSRVKTLQRIYAAELQSLKAINAHIDASKQALRIEASKNRSAELDSLIEKWLLAARAAAEDVYSATRDRVNKLGGVRGLHEKEQRRHNQQLEWEREERKMQQIQMEEERQDLLESIRDQEDAEVDDLGPIKHSSELLHHDLSEIGNVEAENLESFDSGEQCQKPFDAKDEENGYTMAMMLNSLNIDSAMLGLDPDTGQWI